MLSSSASDAMSGIWTDPRSGLDVALRPPTSSAGVAIAGNALRAQHIEIQGDIAHDDTDDVTALASSSVNATCSASPSQTSAAASWLAYRQRTEWPF